VSVTLRHGGLLPNPTGVERLIKIGARVIEHVARVRTQKARGYAEEYLLSNEV
jgi:hypothetical protein